MPLISVIIPAYNAEKTIEETVQSALQQTISDLEVIVIDDGSQDATAERVRQIQDPRLRVVSYPNGGLAIARNRGIALALGDFLSFLDADDLWTPEKLAAQLSALDAHPKAAVAYSWTRWIDDSGQFLRRGGHHTQNGNAYADLLVSNFLENGSNILVRQAALEEVGGFDETLPAAQDWDMGLRLAARYDFACVPVPHVLYRVSAMSMSTNVTRLETASLQVITRGFQNAPAALHHLKRRSLANLYKYLTFKALDTYPNQQQGWLAFRFLRRAIQNDPGLLTSKASVKVVLKLLCFLLLSPDYAKELFCRFPKIFNLRSLLNSIQIGAS